MRNIDHYATNYVENADVIMVANQHRYESVAVEYCISSGYVKIIIPEQKTLITHITNVVIEVR
ncbi:MAG: hypothetical protein GFH23_1086812n39 [Chloroflexi bacterium AL-N1]|nr:hypothetical protein [Chloroflexi bacterium AL-N1]NOK77382.1 hypothetical protein [Chloroflexi bacterium AL-N5]